MRRHQKLVLAIPLAIGCNLQVSQPQTVWEAVLAGSPGGAYEAVGGSAAAIANEQRTVGGITVTAFPAGTYAWRIRAGNCANAGGVLAVATAYPDITVMPPQQDPDDPTPDPGVSAEAVLEAPMLSGGQYHTEVREATTGGLAACGDFAQR